MWTHRFHSCTSCSRVLYLVRQIPFSANCRSLANWPWARVWLASSTIVIAFAYPFSAWSVCPTWLAWTYSLRSVDQPSWFAASLRCPLLIIGHHRLATTALSSDNWGLSGLLLRIGTWQWIWIAENSPRMTRLCINDNGQFSSSLNTIGPLVPKGHSFIWRLRFTSIDGERSPWPRQWQGRYVYIILQVA